MAERLVRRHIRVLEVTALINKPIGDQGEYTAENLKFKLIGNFRNMEQVKKEIQTMLPDKTIVSGILEMNETKKFYVMTEKQFIEVAKEVVE